MDILEEIDEKIKDKKREWDYTPMREKSETDALIDELLKEFSGDAPKVEAVPQKMKYERESESYERYEYNRKSTPDGYTPKHSAENSIEPDATQMFSKEDLQRELEREKAEEERARREAETAEKAPYNGGENEEYDDGYYDDDGEDDDDYYDEDDFSREMSELDRQGLSDAEKDEFDSYVGGGDEERVRIVKPRQKRSALRIIWRVFYTAVIAAFTIIGIFSSVIFVLEKLEMMPSDAQKQEESLKDEMKGVLYPFVVSNIDDFDSPDKISDEQLINLGIWEIVIHSSSMTPFKDGDSGDIVLPHSQVEYACEKLLGVEKRIEPKDIKYSEMEIKYDKDKDGYILPNKYEIYTFRPEVTSVADNDGVYTVYVNYYSDLPSWNDEKKQVPAKTEIYTLEKQSKNYKVTSAKTSE